MCYGTGWRLMGWRSQPLGLHGLSHATFCADMPHLMMARKIFRCGFADMRRILSFHYRARSSSPLCRLLDLACRHFRRDAGDIFGYRVERIYARRSSSIGPRCVLSGSRIVSAVGSSMRAFALLIDDCFGVLSIRHFRVDKVDSLPQNAPEQCSAAPATLPRAMTMRLSLRLQLFEPRRSSRHKCRPANIFGVISACGFFHFRRWRFYLSHFSARRPIRLSVLPMLCQHDLVWRARRFRLRRRSPMMARTALLRVCDYSASPICGSLPAFEAYATLRIAQLPRRWRRVSSPREGRRDAQLATTGHEQHGRADADDAVR